MVCQIVSDVENLRALANLASGNQRVLVVLDAEEFQYAEQKISLPWEQTVENIWGYMLDRIRKTLQGNPFFHLVIRIGLEGGIYTGFKHDSNPRLIYEPSRAKGSFLRSYKDHHLKKLEANSEELRKKLKVVWMAGLMATLMTESAIFIEYLSPTQFIEATITGLRWSHRFAAIRFPKFGAKDRLPRRMPESTHGAAGVLVQ